MEDIACSVSLPLLVAQLLCKQSQSSGDIFRAHQDAVTFCLQGLSTPSVGSWSEQSVVERTMSRGESLAALRNLLTGPVHVPSKHQMLATSVTALLGLVDVERSAGLLLSSTCGEEVLQAVLDQVRVTLCIQPDSLDVLPVAMDSLELVSQVLQAVADGAQAVLESGKKLITGTSAGAVLTQLCACLPRMLGSGGTSSEPLTISTTPSQEAEARHDSRQEVLKRCVHHLWTVTGCLQLDEQRTLRQVLLQSLISKGSSAPPLCMFKMMGSSGVGLHHQGGHCLLTPSGELGSNAARWWPEVQLEGLLLALQLISARDVDLQALQGQIWGSKEASGDIREALGLLLMALAACSTTDCHEENGADHSLLPHTSSSGSVEAELFGELFPDVSDVPHLEKRATQAAREAIKNWLLVAEEMCHCLALSLVEVGRPLDTQNESNLGTDAGPLEVLVTSAVCVLGRESRGLDKVQGIVEKALGTLVALNPYVGRLLLSLALLGPHSLDPEGQNRLMRSACYVALVEAHRHQAKWGGEITEVVVPGEGDPGGGPITVAQLWGKWSQSLRPLLWKEDGQHEQEEEVNVKALSWAVSPARLAPLVLLTQVSSSKTRAVVVNLLQRQLLNFLQGVVGAGSSSPLGVKALISGLVVAAATSALVSGFLSAGSSMPQWLQKQMQHLMSGSSGRLPPSTSSSSGWHFQKLLDSLCGQGHTSVPVPGLLLSPQVTQDLQSLQDLLPDLVDGDALRSTVEVPDWCRQVFHDEVHREVEALMAGAPVCSSRVEVLDNWDDWGQGLAGLLDADLPRLVGSVLPGLEPGEALKVMAVHWSCLKAGRQLLLVLRTVAESCMPSTRGLEAPAFYCFGGHDHIHYLLSASTADDDDTPGGHCLVKALEAARERLSLVSMPPSVQTVVTQGLGPLSAEVEWVLKAAAQCQGQSIRGSMVPLVAQLLSSYSSLNRLAILELIAAICPQSGDAPRYLLELPLKSEECGGYLELLAEGLRGVLLAGSATTDLPVEEEGVQYLEAVTEKKGNLGGLDAAHYLVVLAGHSAPLMPHALGYLLASVSRVMSSLLGLVETWLVEDSPAPVSSSFTSSRSNPLNSGVPSEAYKNIARMVLQLSLLPYGRGHLADHQGLLSWAHELLGAEAERVAEEHFRHAVCTATQWATDQSVPDESLHCHMVVEAVVKLLRHWLEEERLKVVSLLLENDGLLDALTKACLLPGLTESVLGLFTGAMESAEAAAAVQLTGRVLNKLISMEDEQFTVLLTHLFLTTSGAREAATKLLLKLLSPNRSGASAGPMKGWQQDSQIRLLKRLCEVVLRQALCKADGEGPNPNLESVLVLLLRCSVGLGVPGILTQWTALADAVPWLREAHCPSLLALLPLLRFSFVVLEGLKATSGGGPTASSVRVGLGPGPMGPQDFRESEELEAPSMTGGQQAVSHPRTGEHAEIDMGVEEYPEETTEDFLDVMEPGHEGDLRNGAYRLLGLESESNEDDGAAGDEGEELEMDDEDEDGDEDDEDDEEEDEEEEDDDDNEDDECVDETAIDGGAAEGGEDASDLLEPRAGSWRSPAGRRPKSRLGREPTGSVPQGTSAPSRAGEGSSLLCTYTQSGESYLEQHWYYCYTCGLVDSKGCCSACVNVCHVGHDVVYSGRSRFFCDCGAGSGRGSSCKCLTEQEPLRSLSPQPRLDSGSSTPVDHLWVMGDPLEAAWAIMKPWPADNYLTAAWPKELEEATAKKLPQALVTRATSLLQPLLCGSGEPMISSELRATVRQTLGRLLDTQLSICRRLVGWFQCSSRPAPWVNKQAGPSHSPPTIASAASPMGSSSTSPSSSFTTEQEVQWLKLQRIVRLGSIDGKNRSDAQAPPPELCAAVSARLMHRQCVSYSPGNGMLAVSRGQWVGVLDMGQHASEMAAGVCFPTIQMGKPNDDKGSYSFLTRHNAKLFVVSIAFDPSFGRHLLVVGMEEVQVWSMDEKGRVLDRLPLYRKEVNDRESSGPYSTLHGAQWLPGSDVLVAVLTTECVSIYDVSGREHLLCDRVSLPGGGLLMGVACVPKTENLTARLTELNQLVATSKTSCYMLGQDGKLYVTHLARSVKGSAWHLETPVLVQLPGRLPTSCVAKYIHYSSSLNLLQLLLDCGESSTWLMGTVDSETCSFKSATMTDFKGMTTQGDAERPLEVTISSLYDLPLLPASRLHYQAPALVCAVPHLSWVSSQSDSHVPPLFVACPRYNDAAPTPTFMQFQPVNLKGNLESRVEGLACLPSPVTNQSILVVLCNKGLLYFFTTQRVPELLPYEPFATLLKSASTAQDEAGGTPEDVASGKLVKPTMSTRSCWWEAERKILLSTGGDDDDLVKAVEDINGQGPSPSLLERARLMTPDVRVSGQVVGPSNSDALKRLLCDPANHETYAEAPGPSGLKLTFKCVDLDMVIVGMKILVGPSGAGHVPQWFKLGTRTQKVRDGQRRWYQVLLAAGEALALSQEVVLHVGPARGGEQMARVHHVDVFAQKREELLKGAASTGSTMKLPQSIMASSLVAFSNPVHCATTKAVAGPLEYLLAVAFRCSKNLLQLANSTEDRTPTEVVGDMVSQLLAPEWNLARVWSPSLTTQLAVVDFQQEVLATCTAQKGMQGHTQDSTPQGSLERLLALTLSRARLSRALEDAKNLKWDLGAPWPRSDDVTGLFFHVVSLLTPVDFLLLYDVEGVTMEGSAECVERQNRYEEASRLLLYLADLLPRIIKTAEVTSLAVFAPSGLLQPTVSTLVSWVLHLAYCSSPGAVTLLTALGGILASLLVNSCWEVREHAAVAVAEQVAAAVAWGGAPAPTSLFLLGASSEELLQRPLTSSYCSDGSTAGRGEHIVDLVLMMWQKILHIMDELTIEELASAYTCWAHMGSLLKSMCGRKRGSLADKLHAGLIEAVGAVLVEQRAIRLGDLARPQVLFVVNLLANLLSCNQAEEVKAQHSPRQGAVGKTRDAPVSQSSSSMHLGQEGARNKAAVGEAPAEGTCQEGALPSPEPLLSAALAQQVADVLVDIIEHSLVCLTPAGLGSTDHGGCLSGPQIPQRYWLGYQAPMTPRVTYQLEALSVHQLPSSYLVKDHKGDPIWTFATLETNKLPKVLAESSATALRALVQAVGARQAVSTSSLPRTSQVLFSLMTSENLKGSRHDARKVLCGLCPSHSVFRDERALHLLTARLTRLTHLTMSLEQQGAEDWRIMCRVATCLESVLKVADDRPKVWWQYCCQHPDVLPALITQSFKWPMSVGKRVVQLFSRCLSGNRAGRAGQQKPLDLSWLGLHGPVGEAEMGQGQANTTVMCFILRYVLEPPSESLRKEAASCLLEVSRMVDRKDKVALRQRMLSWVPLLQSYGPSAKQYMILLTDLIAEKPPGSEGQRPHQRELPASSLTSKRGSQGKEPQSWPSATADQYTAEEGLHHDDVSRLVSALCCATHHLTTHPYGHVYRQLRLYVDVEGDFLSVEPAKVSTPSRAKYNQVRMETLKAESKYTDCSIAVRLNRRYTVKGFSLKIVEPRKSVCVQQLNFFYSSEAVSDLQQLKSQPGKFIHGLSCHLTPCQTEVKLEFPVPVDTNCVMVEFAKLYTSLQESSQEVMQCPRCSHVVVDKHGVCKFCGENAYQCRHCRNINYEKPDGFICHQCGYSRNGRFEFSLQVATATCYPPIKDEADIACAQSHLAKQLEDCRTKEAALDSLAGCIAEALGPGPGLQHGEQTLEGLGAAGSLSSSGSHGVAKKALLLAVLYKEKCQPLHQELLECARQVLGVQTALRSYLVSSTHPHEGVPVAQSGQAMALRQLEYGYRHGEVFLLHCLQVLLALVDRWPQTACQLLDNQILDELLDNVLSVGDRSTREIAVDLLVSLVKHADPRQAAAALASIRARMQYSLTHATYLHSFQRDSIFMELLVRIAQHLFPDGKGTKSDKKGPGDQVLVMDVQGHAEKSMELFQTALSILREAADASEQRVVSAAILLPCLQVLRLACQNRTETLQDAFRSQTRGPLGDPYIPGFSPRPQGLLGAPPPFPPRPAVPPGSSALSMATSSSQVSQGGPLTVTSSLDSTATAGPCGSTSTPGDNVCEKLMDVSDLVTPQVLNRHSPVVRSEASAILKLFHLEHEELLGRLAGWLDHACQMSDGTDSYFSLMEEVLGQALQAERPELMGHVGAQLMDQLVKTVNHLLEAETSGQLKQAPTGVLQPLVTLVEQLIKAPGAHGAIRHVDCLGLLVWVTASLQALVVQQTKSTSDAEARLKQALAEQFIGGDTSSQQVYIRGIMVAILQVWRKMTRQEKQQKLQPAPEVERSVEVCSGGSLGDLQGLWPLLHHHAAIFPHLLELLSTAVCPVRPDPVYQLLLEKAISQEEFIPGNMSTQPYKSTDVGVLMRDVKNFICSRLDMAGLVEDDFGMELMVAGKIISLSLPIAGVYNCVWKPHIHSPGHRPPQSRSVRSMLSAMMAGGEPPPMVIVYRLSGLDGEATEEVVKQLHSTAEDHLAPEVEFSRTAMLVEGEPSGLTLLLQVLVGARLSGQSTRPLLKVLEGACHLEACRRKLVSDGAVPMLVHLVHQVTRPLLGGRRSAPSGGATPDPELVVACGSEQLLVLLSLLEQLATEANKTATVDHESLQEEELEAAGCMMYSSDPVSDSATEVKHLADAVTSLGRHGYTDCAAVLARVLLCLAHGDAQAQVGLLDHYMPVLNLKDLDYLGAAVPSSGPALEEHKSQLSSFIRLVEAMTCPAAGGGAPRRSGNVFRDLVLHRHIPEHICEYLVSLYSFDPGMAVEDQSRTSPAPTGLPSGFATPRKPPVHPRSPSPKGDSTLLATPPRPRPASEQLLPGPVWLSGKPSPTSRASDPGHSDNSAEMGTGGLGDGPRWCEKGSLQWCEASEKPGLPLALQILTALARSHQKTAQVVAGYPGALALLHLLEGTHGGSQIAPLAEMLLEILREVGGPTVGGQILAIREETKMQMKALAARKRQALLASLGMTQVESDVGTRIVRSPASVPPTSPLAAELAAMEEEEEEPSHLTCMVCREGYRLKPSELLGCYCFTKPVSSDDLAGTCPPQLGSYPTFSTVSHFNLIHISCHQAAKVADTSLRHPKREWEGATLRNGEVLCNNLLPVKGQHVSETAYVAAVSSYWDQLLTLSGSGGLRRATALKSMDSVTTRVSLVASDIAGLLLRFVHHKSFSEDAHGGGRESNARLLPALVQLGRYFVDQCYPTGLEELTLPLSCYATFDSSMRGSGSMSPGEGGRKPTGLAGSSSSPPMPYVLALSILLLSPREWLQGRRAMLLHTIRYAVSQRYQCSGSGATGSSAGRSRAQEGSPGEGMQRTSPTLSRSSSRMLVSTLTDEDIFFACVTSVRMFGLVDWLQKWAKPVTGEEWVTGMWERLQDLPTLVDGASALLQVLDELEDTASAFELFDVMRVLQDVLTEQTPSIGEFLRRACMGLRG